MPSLRLGELKVLLVVADQTLGWAGPGTGGRKETDWLTHSQLKARTGCASEAVSRAIDVLVRRNLIEVESDTGEPLATPESRRRSAGRLYFRLSRRVLAQVLPEYRASAPPARHGRTGVENPVEKSASADAAAPETEPGSPDCEAGASTAGDRKAKTTKETGDGKDTPYGGAHRPEQPRSPGDPNVRRMLAAYAERFARRSPGHEPPLIHWGRDGRLMGQLLRLYPPERVLGLLDRFFALEDAWVRRRGYSLAAFQAAINQLLIEERPARGETGRGGWSRAGSPPARSLTPR